MKIERFTRVVKSGEMRIPESTAGHDMRRFTWFRFKTVVRIIPSNCPWCGPIVHVEPELPRLPKSGGVIRSTMGRDEHCTAA